MRSVTGVEGGGGKTGDLVISWDPLPEQEHNAPGVYYRYVIQCIPMNVKKLKNQYLDKS